MGKGNDHWVVYTLISIGLVLAVKSGVFKKKSAYAQAYDSEMGAIDGEDQAMDYLADPDPVPSFDASDINISSMIATRRSYEANSQYKMLGRNPYFMKYGPYGSYYGDGYDSYLSNWSPK